MAEKRIDLPVDSRDRADWAFHDGTQWHCFRDVIVEDDSTVLAWDEVAGHYTIHHDLTEQELLCARMMHARGVQR